MVTLRCEIRTVDNGWVVVWDEDDTGVPQSHEEIVETRADLRAKLVGLYPP